MSRKSQFDIGFDIGFNTGFDLGYEKAYKKTQIIEELLKTPKKNTVFPQSLLSNTVLAISKEEFSCLVKKFMQDISVPLLSHIDVYQNIKKALSEKSNYTIISACNLFTNNGIIMNVKKSPNVMDVFRKADVILIPCLLDSEMMFVINSLLSKYNIFNDRGLTDIPAKLFASQAIRDLNEIAGTFMVFDKNAKYICNYLNKHRIKATPGCCNDKLSICLLGRVPLKWNLIESLTAENKIIIDIQAIRSKLTIKTFPLGVY